MPFEPGQYAPFPQNLLFPLRNIENLELETVNPDKRFRFDYESNDGIDDEYGDENPLGRINKDAPEVHNIWQANPVFSEKSFRNIFEKMATEGYEVIQDIKGMLPDYSSYVIEKGTKIKKLQDMSSEIAVTLENNKVVIITKRDKKFIKNASLKLAGYSHYYDYIDKARWDIAEECAKLVTKIKLKDCIVEYASARAAGHLGLSITDKNKNNYMACTLDIEDEGAKINIKVGLHKTPRSENNIEEKTINISARTNDTLVNILSAALYEVDVIYGRLK